MDDDIVQETCLFRQRSCPPSKATPFAREFLPKVSYSNRSVDKPSRSRPSPNKIFYAYYGSNAVSKYVAWGSPCSIDFLYANGLRIASMDSSTGRFNTVQCFHTAALGSTRLITYWRGTVNFAHGYQPYGLDNGASGSETYKFTGKPFSTTTGLYYEYSRWYDPSIGRFISEDPSAGRLSDPQSLNAYVYVGNLPTVRTDPTGAAWCPGWRHLRGRLQLTERSAL